MTDKTQNDTNTQRYVALQKLNHNKTKVKAGAVIELTDQEAVFLLKANYVRLATEADGKPVTIIGNPQADGLVKALQAQLVEKEAEIEKLTNINLDNGRLIVDLQNQLKIANDERNGLQALATDKSPAPDYSEMTKAELNAELDKRGIDHDDRAKNADLAELLVADDINREGLEMKVPAENGEADDEMEQGSSI